MERRCSARLAVGGGGAGDGADAGRAREARAAAVEVERARRRALAAERSREVEDSAVELQDKCRQLARAIRDAKHLVVYTGAGISTAAAIPDYRGPRGVWTRLARGETVPRVAVARARPTYTHRALTALHRARLLRFVASQNCDGLHMRAGLPRRALAELHGNMFAEHCARCRTVYLRDFDTTERTARWAHATRRLCHSCRPPQPLQDSIVHFGERGTARWPLNWAGALRHAAAADALLCLGSSLKVLRRYPALWRMHAPAAHRPKLYIVNLQWTPKDAVADLKINARCDTVMREVMSLLEVCVEPYAVSRDPLLGHVTPLHPAERHTSTRGTRASTRTQTPPTTPPPSDPEDELPLRTIAARLRPPPTPPPPPPALRSFQVSLVGGAATILLRATHAPACALRAVRLPRRHGRLHSHLQHVVKSEVKPAVKSEVKPDVKCDIKAEVDGDLGLWARLRLEPDSLAAEYVRRAVARARPTLYPGLHDIIGTSPSPSRVVPVPVSVPVPVPAIAPARAAECSWCLSRFGSRRCLWYRRAEGARRVWRRRRYLCTCCPQRGGDTAGNAGGDAEGDGGWYGKGYRKGRRRR